MCCAEQLPVCDETHHKEVHLPDGETPDGSLAGKNKSESPRFLLRKMHRGMFRDRFLHPLVNHITEQTAPHVLSLAKCSLLPFRMKEAEP